MDGYSSGVLLKFLLHSAAAIPFIAKQGDSLPWTKSWLRHQIETFFALLAFRVGNSPVTGDFPPRRLVMRSFDGFFDLRLNQQLSKHWWNWWFETLWRSLWRHCNARRCCHASQRVTDREKLAFTCIVTSRLWRQLSINCVLISVFRERLAMLTEENSTPKCNIYVCLYSIHSQQICVHVYDTVIWSAL